MTAVTLTLYAADGTCVSETKCLRFSLLKERYLPYDTLRAEVCCAETFSVKPVRAVFSLDGVTLHDGIIRSYSHTESGNQHRLTLTARGYAEALLQNQLVPGLYTDVTLESLMTTYSLPQLTYESGISAVNYIYVKPNTAMWDALSAFCYKYNGSLPYVTRCNHLRLSGKPETDVIALPGNRVLEQSTGSDASTVLSRIDMADIDGTYGTFTASNPLADAHRIVRVKQMLFDRQFLYEPEDALRYRIALSNRRLGQKSISYCGYCGEDLEDMVALSDTVYGHVSRILLRGTESGIETTDTFYFDSICNAS